MEKVHKLHTSKIIWLTKSRMMDGNHAVCQQIRSEIVKGRSLLEDQETDQRIIRYIVIEWEGIVCIYLAQTMYDEGAVVASVMNNLDS
jgi:hypothetical protein